MQEPEEKTPLKHRIPSWLRSTFWAWTFRDSKQAPILPVNSDSTFASAEEAIELAAHTTDAAHSSEATPALKNQAQGTLSHAARDSEKEVCEKNHITYRFCRTTLAILKHNSYINGLLVLVPLGIAAHYVKLPGGRHLHPLIPFAINGLAIVPLANLLAVGTESLAKRVGNTWGALMNVTFGNLVELILFLLAIKKGETRIVQASLIGSILANMLFIFGLSVFVGGMRYKEQAYNSTVSQMNAILLGLCVATLLLPTAFFNAFKQSGVEQANKRMLMFSRGTSFILLVVYVLFICFQLFTHKHLYVGTPQHVLDEEALPGPAANWFDSSSDSSSSDSDTDSNNSSASEGTTAKIKRVINRARRRNASTGSSRSLPSNIHVAEPPSSSSASHANSANHASSAQAEVDNGTTAPIKDRTVSLNTKLTKLDHKERKRQKKAKKKEKKQRRRAEKKFRELTRHYEEAEKVRNDAECRLRASSNGTILNGTATSFVMSTGGTRAENCEPTKGKSSLFDSRPLLPRIRSTGLWKPTQETRLHPRRSEFSTHTPRVYGLHRSGSSNNFARQSRHSNELTPTNSSHSPAPTVAYPPWTEPLSNGDVGEDELSIISAGAVVIISTALVALCAVGLVEAIDGATASGGGPLNDTFVGLIIIPIVGNAAEHFTAVKMAWRNKMDLTIGIAVGSSLQIALFITPVVVLLAWPMGKELSLYFTIFETVALFASVFLVNFLILDGKSNYMEGVIMIGAYIIIALAAWLYPPVDELSLLG